LKATKAGDTPTNSTMVAVTTAGHSIGLIIAFQLSWTLHLSSAYAPPNRLYQAAAFVVQRSQLQQQQQLYQQRQAQQPQPHPLQATVMEKEETAGDDEMVISDELMKVMEDQAVSIAEEIMDDISCEVIPETGQPADEMCVDEEKRKGFRATLLGYVKGVAKGVGGGASDEVETCMETPLPMSSSKKKALDGDGLEAGCTFETAIQPLWQKK
jgi:hypothetical protein